MKVELNDDEVQPELSAISEYIGESADNKWWQCVPDKFSFPKGPNDRNRQRENMEIYGTLKAGMFTFQYQNA